jgi:hypothetical protein
MLHQCNVTVKLLSTSWIFTVISVRSWKCKMYSRTQLILVIHPLKAAGCFRTANGVKCDLLFHLFKIPFHSDDPVTLSEHRLNFWVKILLFFSVKLSHIQKFYKINILFSNYDVYGICRNCITQQLIQTKTK